jgi:hypothetical protein
VSDLRPAFDDFDESESELGKKLKNLRRSPRLFNWMGSPSAKGRNGYSLSKVDCDS